jgi:tetratricopeptide (TPR) repeat protein
VRGRLRNALSNLQQARDGFGACHLVIEGATAAADLALTQLYVSGRATALGTLSPALAALEFADERLSVAHAHIHKGIIEGRGPDLASANAACDSALTAFRALHHTYGVAKATLLRAELKALTADHKGAWANATEALRAHESIGDAHGAALCLARLGEWSIDVGNLEEAEGHLSRALEIINQGGIFLTRPFGRIQGGRIDEAKGNVDSALRHFTEAYNEAKSSTNCEAAASAATHLGGLALIRGASAEARAFLETGVTESNKLGSVPIQVLSHVNMAWLESTEGKVQSRQRVTSELKRIIRSAPGIDFGLETTVARHTKAIELVRGAAEAQRHKHAAAEVLKNV